jgi:hypothetical protein
MTRGANPARRVLHGPPPKSKQRDAGYLLERYLRIAARSDPGKPRTEDAADMALADLLIAIAPFAGFTATVRRNGIA